MLGRIEETLKGLRQGNKDKLKYQLGREKIPALSGMTDNENTKSINALVSFFCAQKLKALCSRIESSYDLARFGERGIRTPKGENTPLVFETSHLPIRVSLQKLLLLIT